MELTVRLVPTYASSSVNGLDISLSYLYKYSAGYFHHQENLPVNTEQKASEEQYKIYIGLGRPGVGICTATIWTCVME